jgi:proton-coupled amino acid transporter
MADQAMLVLTQFGFCCGYLIFLSSTLSDLNWVPWSQALKVLVFVGPLFVLTLLKDISLLAPFNAFANVALLIGCISVIACEANLMIHRAASASAAPVTYTWVNLAGAPVFFGMMSGALEGIGLVIPLAESISETSRSGFAKFRRFIDLALLGVTLLLMVRRLCFYTFFYRQKLYK